MNKKNIPVALTWIGMILIVIGILLPLFSGPQAMLYKYIFASGAALNLAGRAFTPYDGPYIRIKRLVRIELWAALFFCVATYFMFEDKDPKNWIVFVLAGGGILAYTSIMIPIVQRKEANKKK